MAKMASSCRAWFCTMSRSAPVCVVELAAALDADRLGHGDLDRVDVAPIPDRLEEPVAEAEDGEVLDRLLAQVVVDAVDLVLVEDVADRRGSAFARDARS